MKIGIRTLLAVSMGGLVLVATATVLAIALTASARNTFEMLGERSAMLLDGIEDKVRARLDAAVKVVDGVTREVRADRLRTVDPERMLDAFQVVMASTPEIEVLIYWDRAMMRRGVFRQGDGSLMRLGPALESNPRVREALAGFPEGALRSWAEPVVDNGVTFVSVAARVSADDPGPDGPDMAFVVAAVSLERFSASVAAIGRPYGATAFLLYGDDRLLAHPNLASEADPRHGSHSVVSIADSSDPVIANLAKAEPLPFMAAARRRGVEVSRIETDGVVHIVMQRQLEGYGPKPITVGAYFERTELADEIERLAASGIAGMVVVAVAVVLAIVLGGLISRPVRRLASSVSDVARLDLRKAERAPSSSITELDEQARSFNLMLDALGVFETYVPRRLVERLIALGGGTAVPSETRELTVMFTDIERFAEIADRMGAEETATFLNRHFGLLADCIRAENGTIDKYIGDAVMAFWGAPDPMEDHAVRAVRAARAIAASITADNERRSHKGLRPVRLRIGLHSGPAVVGNIGAPRRINYTIVGDTVNVAQRLETLGRRLDCGEDVTIVTSADTLERAGLGPGDAEDMGSHRLAGVSHDVEVRRLRGRPEAEPVVRPDAPPPPVVTA